MSAALHHPFALWWRAAILCCGRWSVSMQMLPDRDCSAAHISAMPYPARRPNRWVRNTSRSNCLGRIGYGGFCRVGTRLVLLLLSVLVCCCGCDSVVCADWFAPQAVAKVRSGTRNSAVKRRCFTYPLCLGKRENDCQEPLL